MADTLTHSDSFVDDQEPKSSAVVWEALCEAKREFDPYLDFCRRVDQILDAGGNLKAGQQFYFSDQEFDLFWSSMEIIKPAVYSRPPQPVVSPRFADRNKVATTASELLERCLVSSFERGDFDQVMLNVRDDLCISARGVTRITYETDAEGGGKRVCDEHVDRDDFLHEPARKWSEVGWVAFAGYLTEREFDKRFDKWVEANEGKRPQFNVRRDTNDGKRVDTAAKCKVWEVWHKADKRVYWVSEGVETFLDESEPFLNLDGFYPCPRPAYGTIKRRSLIPVPDYVRYEQTLEQINDITRRIHGLLDWIRVKGLIPAGGDVATAVETALNQNDDDVLLIPVPGAALMSGAGQFVQFLPLQEFAQTVTGLIEARRELIQNFYELSGISDIMRGATEAEETLGAQQLKQQNGSVRVREKIDELQRLARDEARIAAEIIAEKFDKDELLEMAQMTIPSKREIEKGLKDLEASARKEMEELEKKAAEAAQQAQASGQQFDPAQAEQQFQQAQQAIIAKYEPQIKQLGQQVVIEDVMDLLRDQKARGFSIDIETDSTIMVDEMAEKQARGEFLTAFGGAVTSVQPLLMGGESGVKLAGAILKFSLAPFRAGRELDGLIDDFVEEAPQALAQQQGAEGEDADLAAAQMELAKAEIQKAQAQMAKVQADAALKEQELQLRGSEAQTKAQEAQQKFQLEVEDTKGKIAQTQASIEKIYAEIQLAQQKLGLEAHKEQREDIKTAADIQGQQQDRAMQAQNAERDAAFRAKEDQRADHGEMRADRQQSYSERSGDRQMTLAEKQAQREPAK